MAALPEAAMGKKIVFIEKPRPSRNIVLDVCTLMLYPEDKKELNRNIVVERNDQRGRRSHHK